MSRSSVKLELAAVSNDEGAFRLDNQIGYLLRRAYQRSSANLTARIAIYRLTPPQVSVLLRLQEQGRISQNYLGRLVAMEPANIRDVVLRLKKRRLIRSETDSIDRRLINLKLTETGNLLAEKLKPLSEESVAETLKSVSMSERELLRALLRRIANQP